MLKWVGWLLAALLLLILLLWALAPWRDWAGEYIRARLQAQGMQVESLQVADINLHGLLLQDIRLSQPVLSIPELRIALDMQQLRTGQLEALTLSHMTLRLGGDGEAAGPAMIALPPPSELAALPLKKLRIEALEIIVGEDKAASRITLDGEVSLAMPVTLQLTGEGEIVLGEKQAMQLEGFRLQGEGQEQWKVTFGADKLAMEGEDAPLPPLRLQGEAQSTANAASVSATLHGEDKEKLEITLSTPLPEAAPKLDSALLTLENGTISASPFALKEPFNTTLNIKQLPLQRLLKLALKEEGKLKATGKLKGTVPISWAEGKLRFGKGELVADGPGVLALSPNQLGMLPGGVQQVQQVAALLEDFRYSELKVLLTPEGEDELRIQLALQGTNPAVYEGREVHLNVNLGGDVLETIHSMLGLQSLPEQLIEQLKKETTP